MIVKLTLPDSADQFLLNTEHFICAEPLRKRVGTNARSIVTMEMHSPVEVSEDCDRVFDLIHASAGPASGQSSWVVLAHRPGTATTISLPGIGEVVAFGDDKREFAFQTFREAMDAGDIACEEYGAALEVARIDLVLGVSS